jgi:hypothetical protein
LALKNKCLARNNKSARAALDAALAAFAGVIEDQG